MSIIVVKGRRRGHSVRSPKVRHNGAPVVAARPMAPPTTRRLSLDADRLAALRQRVAAEVSTVIAVLIPVLARPHRVKPLVESFRSSIDPGEATLYFLAQMSDTSEIAAIAAMGMSALLVDDSTRSWAKKINHGYTKTVEPWLLLGADDLAFHRGWVDAARPLLQTHAGVIGTNDLGNPLVVAGQHSTHPLVRRAYADMLGTADEVGKVVHDGYDHNYPDTELVETAKARGLYIHQSTCVIEHLHPVWGKGSHDAVYDLGQRHMREDALLFQQRKLRCGW